jgi:hypothetical protein
VNSESSYGDATDLDIARAIHELHRSIQVTLSDPLPALPWQALPPWNRQTLLNLVTLIKAGGTPKEAQQAWVDRMTGDGWVYGEEKDPGGKTHPGIVSWEDMTRWGRVKVLLAFRVAYTMLYEGFKEDEEL